MLKVLLIVGALFSQAVGAEEPGDEIPLAWHEAGLPVLRFQKDAARNRGWLLTERGIMVFDYRTRQTTAHVRLPGWVLADEGYACAPGLALGPVGEAVVSSNVLPIVWRIDPVTLAVSRHELTLDAHKGMDVGITGLAFSSEQQAYFGVSHFGVLWRIDPLLRRAEKVALSEPLLKACAIAVQAKNRFFRLCVKGEQGSWSVNLAPDRRSGYARAEACT